VPEQRGRQERHAAGDERPGRRSRLHEPLLCGIRERRATREPPPEHRTRGMKLSEKGRHAPPPVLRPRHAQALAEDLGGWAEVIARTHWLLGDESVVDGADFYVGENELGHLHLDGEAHVAVGRRLAAALVDAELARPFAYSKAFVTWPVRTAEDRAHARFLFELRYEILLGTPEAALLARVAAKKPT